MRLISNDNPLGLQLGETVRVKRICFLDYDDNGNKDIRYEESYPFYAIVVGSVKRALGKVKRGGYSFTLDGSDYEPPVFKASKYLRLYEVKVRLNETTMLVHPDDIEVVNEIPT